MPEKLTGAARLRPKRVAETRRPDEDDFLSSEWRGLDAGFECSPTEVAELSETYDDVDLGQPWPHVYATVTRSDGAVVGPPEGDLLRGVAVAEAATRTEIDYLAIEASQIRES